MFWFICLFVPRSFGGRMLKITVYRRRLPFPPKREPCSHAGFLYRGLYDRIAISIYLEVYSIHIFPQPYYTEILKVVTERIPIKY